MWVHNTEPDSVQRFESVLDARVHTGHGLIQKLAEVVDRLIAIA